MKLADYGININFNRVPQPYRPDRQSTPDPRVRWYRAVTVTSEQVNSDGTVEYMLLSPHSETGEMQRINITGVNMTAPQQGSTM